MQFIDVASHCVGNAYELQRQHIGIRHAQHDVPDCFRLGHAVRECRIAETHIKIE
jgi:hypothetical protein